MRIKLFVTLLAALCLSAGFIGSRSTAQTATAGTWSVVPAQHTALTATVRPPIKADGSSVFNATGSAVPVKFTLSTAPKALTFESVLSDNEPAPTPTPDPEATPDPNPTPIPEPNFENDFASLTFTPTGPLAFSSISNLQASYEFTQGNCGGGSLRWSITFDINNDDDVIDPDTGSFPGKLNDKSIFIYYGGYPNFNNCTTGPDDQSGTNMIGLTDLRYDTSQIGGTFYDNYTHAVDLANGDSETPALNVVSVSLNLDSGWMGDQRVNLGSAKINENQFVPLTGAATTTCTLPPAQISVTFNSTNVDTPTNVQRKFVDSFFRNTNDCTYSYNLAKTSLFGPGQYTVNLVIDSQLVPNAAQFTLR